MRDEERKTSLHYKESNENKEQAASHTKKNTGYHTDNVCFCSPLCPLTFMDMNVKLARPYINSCKKTI